MSKISQPAAEMVNDLFARKAALKISQAAWADQSGISASAISRLESGERMGITIDTYARLNRALDDFEQVAEAANGSPKRRKSNGKRVAA